MTWRDLWPFGGESGDTDDTDAEELPFETGLRRRREIPPFELEGVDLLIAGRDKTIAGAHREHTVEAKEGYSTLGRGGPLIYPETTREVVVVTESGERHRFTSEDWMEILKHSCNIPGRRP
jgi:hypothetical protein